MFAIEERDQILELETEEALEAVEKALKEEEHEELYLLQGMIYLKDCKTELALECYEKAVDFNNENYLSYIAKAKYYMDENENDKAGALFQIAVDKRACKESLYSLGYYYAYEDEEEKAVEYFTKAIESQDDTMFFENKIIYDERGMCNYYLSNYEKAISDFWKAFELSNKSYNPYPDISNAYKHWQKPDKTIEINDQYKNLNPKDVSFNINEDIDEIYNNTIQAYQDLGQYDLAIKECDDFIEGSKKNLIEGSMKTSYRLIGITITKAEIYLEKLEDKEKSDEVISELLSISFENNDINAIRDIASFYDATEQYQKQIDLVSNVDRKIFADNHYCKRDVIMKLANAYYNLNIIDEAIKTYKEARILDLEDFDSYQMLAKIYHSQGKKKEALEQFDLAQKNNEGDLYIIERKMKLCSEWEYYDEALETCEFLINKEYYVSNMYFDKGIILTDMNKKQEALDAYYVSLDLNRESVRPYIHMYYLHRDLGLNDKAIEDTGIVIESGDKNILHFAYYQRSSNHYANGNVEQAIEDMDRALKTKPDYRSAAVDLSEMLMIGGYCEKGLKVLEDNIGLYVGDKKMTIYYFLKFLGHILLKQIDKAEEAKKKYIETGKKHAGDFEFGVRHLERNIKTDEETLKNIMEVASVYFN